jgi:hypothetical protein
MAAVLRSDLVAEVRRYAHAEHLSHVSDAEIAARLDRSYRRLRAILDQARGHEVEKREAVVHIPPGTRALVLPVDFHQLRNFLLRRAQSVETFL